MTEQATTKTGKSLKQVRRYYAQKNAKGKKTIDKSNEGTQQQKGMRKKTVEDDKLSRRIAVELKTQQDANEKRNAGLPTRLSKEDVASPKIVHNVRISPDAKVSATFTPSPVQPQNADDAQRIQKSAKSLKSTGKSIKSLKQGIPITGDSQAFEVTQLSDTSKCIISTTATIAIVNFVSWIYILILKRDNEPKGAPMGCIAINSALVLVSILPYINYNKELMYVLPAFVLICLTNIGMLIYFIFFGLKYTNPPTSTDDTNSTNEKSDLLGIHNEPLRFLLEITFFSFLITTAIILLRRIIEIIRIKNLNPNPSETKNMQDLKMSELMTP